MKKVLLLILFVTLLNSVFAQANLAKVIMEHQTAVFIPKESQKGDDIGYAVAPYVINKVIKIINSNPGWEAKKGWSGCIHKEDCVFPMCCLNEINITNPSGKWYDVTISAQKGKVTVDYCDCDEGL